MNWVGGFLQAPAPVWLGLCTVHLQHTLLTSPLFWEHFADRKSA